MHVRRGVCLIALFLGACASANGARPPAGTSHRDPNVISADELATVHERTAYELVQVLRPAMLTKRGATSIANGEAGIMVFIDNQRFGDLNSLKQLPTAGIREIRYVSPGEAQAMWGPGYTAGVIAISMANR